jgi:NTE family protein
MNDMYEKITLSALGNAKLSSVISRNDYNKISYDYIRHVISKIFDLKTIHIDDNIAENIRFIEVPAGSVLMDHGKITKELYVVVSGRLRIALNNGLHDIEPGAVAWRPDFLDGSPTPQPITAWCDTVVMAISQAVFVHFMNDDQRVGLGLLRAIIATARYADPVSITRPKCMTIALVPLGPIADFAALVDTLRANCAALGGRTDVLTAQDQSGIASRLIGAAATCAETLLLVADPTATPWSHACVAHADEICLIADAAQTSPSRHPLEQDLLGPLDAEIQRDCTLVLLHAPSTTSPTGTRNWLSARKIRQHVHVKRGDERHLRRLSRILTRQSIGLVLSGGGARGLAHVGVLDALEEAGIEIDMVGGTSIGAVIGGLFALGRAGTALRHAVHKAFIAGGNPVGDFHLLPIISLVRGARARRVTREGIIDAAGEIIDIEDCWINFFCMATNVTAHRSCALTRGLMEQAVLASFAIPGVLPPVVIDQHLHIDGGVSNNLPVDIMASAGAHRIIAVDVVSSSARKLPFEQIPSPLSLLCGLLPWRRRKGHRMPGLVALMHKASTVGAVSRQPAQAACADLTIRPQMRGVGQLSWKKMDVAIEAGYDAATDCLASLDPKSLNAFRTIQP